MTTRFGLIFDFL